MKNEDVATRMGAMEAMRFIDSQAKGYVPALIEVLKDENAHNDPLPPSGSVRREL